MRKLNLEYLEARELKTVDTSLDLTAETETSTAAFVKYDGIDGESLSVSDGIARIRILTNGDDLDR